MLGFQDILFDEEPHVYKYKGKSFDSVTQVIRLAGMGDDFSAVNAERMEYARRRGRMVHVACHYVDEGCLDAASVHESIRGYVDAYQRFLKECPVTLVAVEQKMVSEALALAGTPDWVGFIRGRRSVIDRKTSQHMSGSMGLQTAGYKKLWNSLYPNRPIHDRYGLRLEPTGKYKLVPHENPDDEPCFDDVMEAARAERKMHRWRTAYGYEEQSRTV